MKIIPSCRIYQTIVFVTIWISIVLESVNALTIPGRSFPGKLSRFVKGEGKVKNKRNKHAIPGDQRINKSIQVNPYSAEANEKNLELMRARAAKLRSKILTQQMELQQLDRQIMCCSSNTIDDDSPFFRLIGIENSSPLETMQSFVALSLHKFKSSTDVLSRKLSRVESKTGKKNQNFASVEDYIAYETAAGARIVTKLVQNPDKILHLVDRETPTLAPHLPAILSRLDQLEDHVVPILERVLNNKQHLPSIEPYLDEILERFDDIEPHLSWILDNIDALAPYCGSLLKHIDELLLYAEADERESFRDQYDMAEQILPYLEFYISRLDSIGPHLPLLRPHVPKLLIHNRIGKISPHIDKLFVKGYSDLSASANMDILLFWFGWTLRIPGLPALFFALPRSPKIVTFLANRLPRRFVRGHCSDITCIADNEYGQSWNKLSKE